MAISVKQLSYFVALAETRSFSVAAARVHISQPGMSQQIKELEANLGVSLAERLPKEVRLTRAGQMFVDRARRILGDLRDLEQAVRMHQGLAGRLTLGVIPTIAPYLLPLALTRLRAWDVTLDIRVREAQTAKLVEDVVEGHLDAAIISLPVDLPDLAVEPLFEDRFLLAGSRARMDPLTRQGEIYPDMIPQDQVLLLDEGHCLADQAINMCGLSGGPRRMDLGAASLATLCGLVGQGFGLTILPELALRTEAAATQSMELRRFAPTEPARVVALIRRDTTDASDWASDLARILSEAGQEMVTHARNVL